MVVARRFGVKPSGSCPHRQLAGRAVVVARRMGVRAQFGDAVLARLSAFGRIGIRPQFCYRVPIIGAAEKAWAGYQFCYRVPVIGAAEKAGAGYQFCYRVPAIGAVDKAGAGYQFCYRVPAIGAAENAGAGYQFCYRVPVIGAAEKAGAGYSTLYFQRHQRHAGLFL